MFPFTHRGSRSLSIRSDARTEDVPAAVRYRLEETGCHVVAQDSERCVFVGHPHQVDLRFRWAGMYCIGRGEIHIHRSPDKIRLEYEVSLRLFQSLTLAFAAALLTFGLAVEGSFWGVLAPTIFIASGVPVTALRATRAFGRFLEQAVREHLFLGAVESERGRSAAVR